MRVALPPDPAGRLGFLVSRFPVRTETFVVRELWGLQRAGIDFEILSLWPPADAIESAELRDLAPRLHYAPPPDDEPNRGWASWVASRSERLGLTHLHAHFAWGATRVARLASRLAGIPYSFTAHAGDIFAGSNAETLARYADGADCILTCTQANRDVVTRIVDRLPTSPPVLCFYHGLPARWFDPVCSDVSAGATPLVVSVGRLVPTKGHAILIEAIRRLTEQGRGVRCVIVGDGPERGRLDAQVASASLGDVVGFRQGLAAGEMRRLYRSARVCVHAGIVGRDGDRDGIPNALVEAMATGTPVIATDLASTREIVGEDAGLLVAPGDAGALADALAALLDSPALADRVTRVASRRVRESFDLDTNSQELARFWRRRLRPALRTGRVVAASDRAAHHMATVMEA